METLMKFMRGIQTALGRTSRLGRAFGGRAVPVAGAVAALGLSSQVTYAQEPAPAQASATVSTDGAVTSSAPAPSIEAINSPTAPPAEPALVHHPIETGLFLGALLPPRRHALHAAGAPLTGKGELDDVAPEFGLRFGILPIPYLGVEVEGAIMPTSAAHHNSRGSITETGGATLFALRGHLVLQYPFASVTPFVTGGVGRHWLRESLSILGNDDDTTFHFGAGVKIPLKKHLLVRIDVRDTFLPGQGPEQTGGPGSHWPEALLGLTYACGGKAPPPPPRAPIDSDRDGLTDDVDKCPVAPANTPDGCPIPDTDGDGVVDNVDECPKEVGNLPNGCPDLDPDKDLIPVPADVCPTEPGIAPDGCPDKDTDKDGIPVPGDKCPEQAETKNGYEDADGCPDEVPEIVKQFTGVIKGINFDLGKATIRSESFPLLDSAAKVLTDFPSLRLEISGHTDSLGTATRNLELSKARAESVRAYLMTKGVGSERLEARGVGPDEPVADNKTKAGQALNRRIEFKILQ